MTWMDQNWLLALAGIILLAAMLSTSVRRLRGVALVAGIVAMVHFAFFDPDWLAFALVAMIAGANAVRFMAMTRRSKSGEILEAERELFEHIMRVDDPKRQDRLRDLITWEDTPAETVLMRQGETAPPLIYVASGTARIENGGDLVGECSAGDFLGEMSIVSGDVASATVTASNPMRIARFDRHALSDMVRDIPEIGKAIDAALNRSLASKVLRMNQSMTGGDS